MANIVRQGLFFSIPGFHFGIILTTRKASWSSKGSMLFSIFSFVTEPSLLMINDTTTLPSSLWRCAKAG